MWLFTMHRRSWVERGYVFTSITPGEYPRAHLRTTVSPLGITSSRVWPNHLKRFCLTWFGCRIIFSFTVLCLSVCWNFMSVLTKYLICILEFCNLWLMPISRKTTFCLRRKISLIRRELNFCYLNYIFIYCIIFLCLFCP